MSGECCVCLNKTNSTLIHLNSNNENHYMCEECFKEFKSKYYLEMKCPICRERLHDDLNIITITPEKRNKLLELENLIHYMDNELTEIFGNTTDNINIKTQFKNLLEANIIHKHFAMVDSRKTKNVDTNTVNREVILNRLLGEKIDTRITNMFEPYIPIYTKNMKNMSIDSIKYRISKNYTLESFVFEKLFPEYITK
jgi:hypothetical protein